MQFLQLTCQYTLKNTGRICGYNTYCVTLQSFIFTNFKPKFLYYVEEDLFNCPRGIGFSFCSNCFSTVTFSLYKVALGKGNNRS